MPSSLQPSAPVIRRNRWWFIAALIGVLAIGGIFARAASRALYVRSVTGSVFADYVLKHHLGHAVVTDDASGFQDDMCTLYLNRQIPESRLKQTTVKLAYQYYSLDGGNTLSIVYDDRRTHHQVTEASTFYPGGDTLMVTLNAGGRKWVAQVPVHWPPSGVD